VTKRINKKKKELRIEFERIQGEKFIRGISNHLDPSWFDWVDLKMKYK